MPMPLLSDRKIRYRVGIPILCLAFRDNHHAAVTIRAGKIFEVVGPAQDDRFVVVDVDGEQFLVFGSDLMDYGKLVADTTVRAVAHTAASNGLAQSEERREREDDMPLGVPLVDAAG